MRADQTVDFVQHFLKITEAQGESFGLGCRPELTAAALVR
jgi:hypothetical protein